MEEKLKLKLKSKLRNYSCLSNQDRVRIELWKSQEVSNCKIAFRLGFNPSTIGREINRNKDSQGKYRSIYAIKKSRNRLRSRKLGKSKILTNQALKKYVDDKIKSTWSPNQIAISIKNTNDGNTLSNTLSNTISNSDMPNLNLPTISHESIYQYIYVLPRGSLKKELIEGLRQSRKYRRTQRQKNIDEEKRVKIQDMLSIHERPIEVESRTVPGHWESDLIIGKYKRSAVATLVERTSRYTIIVPLPEGKGAIEVNEALKLATSKIPSHLKRTLTHDQGKEMSKHKEFTNSTGIKVYFADPASPWQRGSNENTNGLIRQFFPKGTDFNLVTQQEIQRAQDLLNSRPRKVIDYKTPNEVFFSYIALEG